MLLAEERKESILKMLEDEGSVKVSKLIKFFNVSIETVRRDLESLEKEGFLKRVYGGAIIEKSRVNQIGYIKREKKFIDEKKEIAKIAIKYVAEGQSIALNNSTTNIEFARELKKNFKELTILTNSLFIASELADANEFNIILAGGILNKKEYAFYGDIAIDTLSNFVVDKAFISVSGVSLDRGITEYLTEEVQMEKKLIGIAQEIIILADHSKIDSVSLIKVMDIYDANLIITDSELEPKIVNKYKKNGIEIIME